MEKVTDFDEEIIHVQDYVDFPKIYRANIVNHLFLQRYDFHQNFHYIEFFPKSKYLNVSLSENVNLDVNH